MPIFQETHPRKDNTPRRPLTKADLDFLSSLQSVLNTQDTMGNADPRFWVIKGQKEVPASGYDTADVYHLSFPSNPDVPDADIRTIDDMLNLIRDPAFQSEFNCKIVQESIDSCTIETETDTYLIRTMRTLLHILDELNVDYDITYAMDASSIYPDTLFLTHAACEDHLRKYGYNYDKTAHAYAMTAVRSPEFERLLKLLQTVDWAAVQPSD